MFSELYNSKIKPPIQKAIDEIKHPSNNPQLTALSMSLGMFVGIIIPLGLQSVTFLVLLPIIRFNLIIAVGVSLISNPLTILPIYYVAIKIGEFLVSELFPWKYFAKFINDPRWEYFFKFGLDGTIILMSGLTFMAIVLSTSTYFLSFRLTSYLKNRKELH